MSAVLESSTHPAGATRRPALPAVLLAGTMLFILATAGVSVAFPLATYTLSLAVFGLAHVLSELRYVDLRYGRSIGLHLRWTLGILLAGVVSLRLSNLTGLLPVEFTLPAEVGLVVLLSLSVLPHLTRHSLRAAAVGSLVSLALIVGLLLSPIHTLLVLAISHNLTPLGFLADALPPRRRRKLLLLAVAVFVGIPIFIASGIPFSWLYGVGLVAPEASILPAGPLANHFGAYLHPAFQSKAWALHAFSAVVFAQCMHYAVVIHVLPRLLPRGSEERGGLLRWPKRGVFTALIIVASALLFALFVWSFSDARAIYGVAAALHAWVEVPILMLAILAGFGVTGSLAQEVKPE